MNNRDFLSFNDFFFLLLKKEKSRLLFDVAFNFNNNATCVASFFCFLLSDSADFLLPSADVECEQSNMKYDQCTFNTFVLSRLKVFKNLLVVKKIFWMIGGVRYARARGDS